MIKVIPDFAGRDFQQRALRAIQWEAPFLYRSGTMWPGYTPPAPDPNAYDSPQLVCPLHEENKPLSPMAWMVDRLCGMLAAREGAYVENIHRSKINANAPAPHIPEGGHYPPHRDMTGTAHTVALYYPMDSDGDTVFFTERLTDGQLVEHYRVSPKADTLVYFDGEQLHAAEPPRKYPIRFSINITLINKGENKWPTTSLT